MTLHLKRCSIWCIFNENNNFVWRSKFGVEIIMICKIKLPTNFIKSFWEMKISLISEIKKEKHTHFLL